MSRVGFAPKTLREWLSEGPFSLAMSSGFFSFFAHTGVMLALEEEGFAPSGVGGSSAGALVAGMWASGTSARESARALSELVRADFWDPKIGLGVLAGKKFEAKVDQLLTSKRFEECRVPLAVSVFDLYSRSTRSIREGRLAPAIVASCTVPLMFHPVWLNGRPTWDGGILDRPGMLGMPEQRMFYHHIVSRSPWRRKNSAALTIPTRSQMVSLSIDDLPRSGPFRLEEGRSALRKARETMLRALDAPLAGDRVRISATL